MIKRQNWAVAFGGGEYGSEDSSDSELEEEDKEALPSQALSLSWAEAVAQSEQISSDDEVNVNEYANMALRGPIQTAAVGGYRGHSFERKSIVPSSEDESDGGFSSGNEGEAESRAQQHHKNETKKEKLGRQQREARRLKARRARKTDLRAAKAAITGEDGTQGGEGTKGNDQSDEIEDEEARAREAKLKAKFERFKEHAERHAYTVEEPGEHYGRKMYRSPLFPNLKIFSAEQLRHHMLTKKYKRAERKQKESEMSAEQRQALLDKKKARRARKQARQSADTRRVTKSRELSKEQIAAAKAKFAAKKTRRLARKGVSAGATESAEESSGGTKKRPHADGQEVGAGGAKKAEGGTPRKKKKKKTK